MGKSPAAEPVDPVLEWAAGVETPAEKARSFDELRAKYAALSRKFAKTLRISDEYAAQIKKLDREVGSLAGKITLIKESSPPLCVYCRKIRLDEDSWRRLENLLVRDADVMFTKGVCPDCLKTGLDRLGEHHHKKNTPTIHDLEPNPQKNPATKPPTDETLEALKELAARIEIDAPTFGPDMRRFVERFEKINRRFAKTLAISDGYQSHLQDLTLRLEFLARTDQLTGLANRWEMTNRLEVEKSRTVRHNGAFGLILADLDHFKRINDHLGHQCGDLLLRRVAAVLAENIRTEDLCARWGGEEFMILIPETDLDGAFETAEKLRKLVAELVVVCRDEPASITISCGVGAVPPNIPLEHAMRLVDDALYKAKESGRNRTVKAD